MSITVRPTRWTRWTLGAAALALSALAQAATTDISKTPLVVASPTTVQPNLIFILDDSGSMNFDYLPDHVNDSMCRSVGAGINSGNSYSGSFGNSCCQDNSGDTCWVGAAPFGTARAHPPFLSSSFNGVAYNPALSYTPPVNAAGISYASQTSANTASWTSVKNDAYNIQNTGSINLITQFPDTEWCVDDTYADCLRNGNYVLPGRVNNKNYTVFHAVTATGSGLKATGAPDNASTVSQSWGPHYYRIIPSEYCDDVNLRNCQNARSDAYPHAAAIRWCNSDAEARASTPSAGACQAVRTGTYSQVRYPTKYFNASASGSTATPATAASSQFAINALSCNAQVTAVTVNGVNLLSSSTTTTSSNRTLGNSIRDRINAGSSGYSASTSNSGSTVKITAPLSAGAVIYTVSITRSGNCAVTTNPATPAFSGYAAPVYGGFAGAFERVDLIPSNDSYPKAAGTREDCAGATACTYAEEMTNFANWWTYYHSRMQAMKSSASLAFGAVTGDYRVGYMSINNSQGNDYLNVKTFTGADRTTWFSRLTNARPNSSTPLRTALSRVGRIYGGRLNGSTVNGTKVEEPMQYSCQRNFTILSTDGYWNESSNPLQLDGTTAIKDQDSGLTAPMKDGTATENTLADVAAYYYNTDSRTGTTGSSACTSAAGGADVCGNDTLYDKQRMVTFTLGLGAPGYMQFLPNYLTASSGDFFAIAQGSTANPSGGVCGWQSSGECTWPKPVNNTPTTIDDMWHAAVNGGGTYFSAGDPSQHYPGLKKALLSIDATTGAAAAATTSNPNVTAGDNQVFISNFVSGEWSGELKGQRIDVDDGTLETNADGSAKVNWSARTLLNGNTSRTIYMFDSAKPNKLKPFTWGELSTSEKAYFELSHITASGAALTQFCSFGDYCLSSTDQSKAAGEALQRFIVGERVNEGDLNSPGKYFRERAYVLGDIVNSEATYAKLPQLSLTSTGYAEYKAKLTADNRAGMVYVGANDGMLHAFDAATGVEVWAYVPTLLLPKLYKLADKAYPTQHEFYADGSPVVQDAYINGQWRTILVAGLGAGGRGYYALDVTDPTKPVALWEFSDANMGLSMGKAEIAKLAGASGKWVVMFPSGYNNVSPGDGVGRLYVRDAADGSEVLTISTGVGSTTTPSGLGHIRAWADNANVDNTVARVYAGDNLGNVWRFDVNNTIGTAGADAQRLATLKDPSNNPQPITSKPEIGAVNSVPMVFVGTGRYLGTSDLNDANVQSIYGIKDRMTAQDYGNPRDAANKFVKQTLTVSKCPAGVSICTEGSTVRSNGTPQAVDLAVNGGWYVDLPATRERVNTDPFLVQGTLVVNSNIIDTASACTVGGSSYINFFDYRTGGAVSTAKYTVSVPLGNALATRPAIVRLPNNKLISFNRLSNDKTVPAPIPNAPNPSVARRLSWRELSTD